MHYRLCTVLFCFVYFWPGGDDVQQLCEAGEEEFLEIMALVGMASKPLHVRRLQKALQEWVSSPCKSFHLTCTCIYVHVPICLLNHTFYRSSNRMKNSFKYQQRKNICLYNGKLSIKA